MNWEKNGSQETIIYQNENQAYYEMNIYDSYDGKFICDIVEYSVSLDDDSIKTIHLQLSFYPQGYSGDRYDYNIYIEFSNIGETTVNKPLKI